MNLQIILFVECYSLICTDQYYFAADNVYILYISLLFSLLCCNARAFVIWAIRNHLPVLTYKFHCRVERGAETQVSEAAFDSRWQRQCGQHHRLPVPRRSRWHRRHAQTTDTVRPSTAMPQSSNATSHVKTSADFCPSVHGHQGKVTSPVADWPYWRVQRPISASRDVHQWTYRFREHCSLVIAHFMYDICEWICGV